MEHKHNLEIIASTNFAKGQFFSMHTTYSICTGCEQLYQTTYLLGARTEIKTKPYKGLLNKSQLLNYAKKSIGELTRKFEESVLHYEGAK